MLQSVNPTAQQSQQWIIQGLLDLMGETSYDRISVSGICRRADLDRRTFYRNFDSKNDVLEQYIRILGEEYLELFAAIEHPDKYNAAKIFFEFWSRHLCFIRNMKTCGLSDFVFRQFEKFTKEHAELLIGGEVRRLPAEYVFAYRIGGFWNAMLTWAAEDVTLSPDEMASILCQI